MTKEPQTKREASQQNDILEVVANKAQVYEGKEIIRRILREIYRFGTMGTKSLARKLHLPIPTVAAIRKELEFVKLIDRNKKGAILTEKGLTYILDELHIESIDKLHCSNCDGTTIVLPHDAEKLIARMKGFTAQRPKPLTNIDQAFGKPITAIRRAYFMLENDDLEGRDILLLGDDDFTSLAIALLQVKAKITVIDIDERLLNIIQNISKENGFEINCIQHDLREPIPEDLKNTFDVILTDPPYTINGLNLFLSRGLQALKDKQNKKIYLAYAHRPPTEMHEIQKAIITQGLAINQLLPGFNLYEGAEMHGNTTFLAILATSKNISILYPQSFTDHIYTGEINPTTRIYQCKNGHEISVGSGEDIKTIEDLKASGCPICKNKESFIRIKTIRK